MPLDPNTNYLRNKITGDVFVRTPELSGRADMEPFVPEKGREEPKPTETAPDLGEEARNEAESTPIQEQEEKAQEKAAPKRRGRPPKKGTE